MRAQKKVNLDAPSSGFIPFVDMKKRKIQEAEKERQAMEMEQKRRQEFFAHHQTMEERKTKLEKDKAILKKYGELYRNLQVLYDRVVLPKEAFAIEIAELFAYLSDFTVSEKVRVRLMNVLCFISLKQQDYRAPTFIFPNADQFVFELKEFLLKWAGLVGTGELLGVEGHDRWMELFRQYSCIELVVTNSLVWKISQHSVRFIYMEERKKAADVVARQESIDILNGLMEGVAISEQPTEQQQKEGVKRGLTFLRQKLKESKRLTDEQKKKAMVTVVQKEEEVIFDITFCSEYMYPYMTAVFGDMMNSRNIIQRIRGYTKVVAPTDFVASMNIYVILFLKQYQQNDLVQELQELKFFPIHL